MFVVVTSPESFEKKLLQIEKELRIDPEERFSAQLPFAVKHANDYIGTPPNTKEWKSAIIKKIICYSLIIITIIFIFMITFFTFRTV